MLSGFNLLLRIITVSCDFLFLSDLLGAIQVLRNAVGVSNFPEKSMTKVYGSMILALRWGGWVVNFPEKGITYHLNGPFWNNLGFSS